MPSARTFKQITPGSMRFVGDLEVQADGTDAAGTPLANFVPFATGIFFEFADYRATEASTANTVMGSLTTYIVIRWRPGVEGVEPAKMRLKWASDLSVSPPVVEYYDIQGAIRDSTARWALQLSCVRRDSAGFRPGAPS
jgi:Phage head-tail joining protein